jgi:hypothetical protein
MAVIIKTAFLVSLYIILLTYLTTQMVKPIDVFADADDSVDAAAQVYISDYNSDENYGGGAAAGDSTRVNSTKEKETRWWITKTSLA